MHQDDNTGNEFSKIPILTANNTNTTAVKIGIFIVIEFMPVFSSCIVILNVTSSIEMSTDIFRISR